MNLNLYEIPYLFRMSKEITTEYNLKNYKYHMMQKNSIFLKLIP